jgi:3',5'-cyclic-AMP phosphodiesterase
MIIAHLSDPHHGPLFVERSYNQATSELLELRPDVIVISGDFTENGILSEYKQAAEHLQQLEDFPLVTVPGNHDYRNTGYLVYRRLFGSRQNLSIGKVVFYAVGTARPDRDEGEVGFRQSTWLEESLKRDENKVRVVVMHHHLVQVPDTGTDRITVVDAGDVLKGITRQRTELVLCGHRHRPWMWKVNHTLITHAGTVSTSRTRGFFANTYNIIDLNESTGTVKVFLKVVGGKRIDMSEVLSGEPYFPPGMPELKPTRKSSEL